MKFYNVSHDMVQLYHLAICSTEHCCSKHGFTADDIFLFFFCVSPNKIAKHSLQNVDPGTVDTAHMLLKLIFITDGSFRVNLPCFEDDVQFLISHLSST